jgi:hypothetical protein
MILIISIIKLLNNLMNSFFFEMYFSLPYKNFAQIKKITLFLRTPYIILSFKINIKHIQRYLYGNVTKHFGVEIYLFLL